MKNRKLIAALITALMLFVCSATAFAEDVPVPDTEPSMITEVTEAITTDNTTHTDDEELSTESDAESTTNEENEGVTVIREEVSLETKESTETDIEINTSDVSITKGEPKNEIAVYYEDSYTDIPMTGSSKVVAVGTFVVVCGALIGVILTKKHTH